MQCLGLQSALWSFMRRERAPALEVWCEDVFREAVPDEVLRANLTGHQVKWKG
jgi:hypothetical protein